MAGQTRVLAFAEGESVEAPTTTFLQTTSYATYANDAAYEAAVGAPANGGSYYNSTDHVVRVYLNGAWTTEMNGAFLYLYVNETGNQAAADGLSGFEVRMSDATNARITYSSTAASRFIMGDAGSESEVMTVGTAQTVSGVKTHSAQLVSSNTDEATDKDTGAIVTEGGIGVEKSVHAGVSLKTDGFFRGNFANDTATGANQTLTAPTTSTVRLTDGSLTSIDMIPAGASEQFLKLVNATGGQVTINNDTGATAAQRILTGTGANLTLEDEASLTLRYDNTESRWMVVGGSGSGTGSGVFNYIEEGDGVTISSWVAYANTTPGDAPDDFGGTASGNFTLTSNTTTPLRGTTDMQFSKTASDEQGEGFYYPFTIRNGDLSSVSRLIANFKTSTDYATGDLRFYVVTSDDSFSADFKVLRFAKGELDARLVAGYGYDEVQFGAVDVDARFCVHVASTNASAYDVNTILEFAPREVAVGPIMGELTQYDMPIYGATSDPTVATTNNFEAYYKDLGDQLYINWSYLHTSNAGAAAGSGNYGFGLPPGYEIDENKILTFGGDKTRGVVGTAGVTGGASEYWGVTRVAPNIFTNAVLMSVGNDVSAFANVSSSFARLTASSLVYGGEAIVPIKGRRGTGNISEQLNNQPVYMVAHSNAGTGVTASVTDVPYTVTEVDTTNSWDGDSFTCPEDGLYIAFATARVTGASLSIFAYLDGTNYGRMQTGYASAASHAGGPIAIFAQAGQVISIRYNSSVTLNATGSQEDHRLSIYKVATPQTLAGSEVVSFRANETTGQSIADVTQAIVIFNDVDHDTHNAYDNTTGIYTVPKNGKYYVSGNVRWANVTSLVRTFGTIHIDTTEESRGTDENAVFTLKDCGIFDLAKGQTIDFRAYQDHSGGSARSLTAFGPGNHLSIYRIN